MQLCKIFFLLYLIRNIEDLFDHDFYFKLDLRIYIKQLFEYIKFNKIKSLVLSELGGGPGKTGLFRKKQRFEFIIPCSPASFVI
ncbi:hypothetical protein BpHYR1_041311 [Brachionus plicatilis]|uniref:Uncharacterized protein n=1 Tax=Brachionus plicatilis TaxID=10195 RepID=A0A3M7R539_BRAPC|nr:hypothetical protein BpHYR1_041311 [Brachionus plicatilis]